MNTTEIESKPDSTAGQPPSGSLHSACSASLVIDVLRGPDVEAGARVIDANIKSAKHGINWSKTRRHLESALKAAKQGNVVQVTILMQRTSLPNVPALAQSGGEEIPTKESKS